MPGIMAVAILLVVFSAPALADIYTWTDPRGVVHFTDTPRSGRPSEPVEVMAPVTLPMAENLQQHRRISGIREQVRDALDSDRKQPSARKHRKRSGAKQVARQKKVCDRYRQKLARIQSKLRSGYGIREGNRLRRQRRDLNRSLSWECILR